MISSGYSSRLKVSSPDGSTYCAERVETTKVPGATTSGLNRPDGPSCPMPTLPRAEKAATWLELSVMLRNRCDRLVVPSTTVVTKLVMSR